MAEAGAWGVLRNMQQEFPGFKWAGADRDSAAASGSAALQAGTDAFGSAADGELYHIPIGSIDSMRSNQSAAANSFADHCFSKHPTGSAWWTPRLLPATSAPAIAAGAAGAGGLAAPDWLAGRSLLITGGLGSLGILFSLWAIQQARDKQIQRQQLVGYDVNVVTLV